MKETYDPSPLEIWRLCSEIQAAWTPDEERKRRAVAVKPWRPPGSERNLRIRVSSRVEIQ